MLDNPNGGERILIFGRRWTPSGRIRVWDENVGSTTTDVGGEVCQTVFIGWDNEPCFNGDTINCPTPIYEEQCFQQTETSFGSYVPIAGAQILMRQFFTVAQGITDAQGNFTTGSVRGKAKYVAQWERHQYSILRGTVFQAEMKGPRTKTQSWYKDIRLSDQRDHYHAIIHAAAHWYFYSNRLGLRSPVGPSDHLKIGARPVGGNSNHVPFRANLSNILPFGHIHIKEWGDPTDDVYGTTIHELAHAGHYELDTSAYHNIVQDGYTNPLASDAVRDNNRRLLET